MKQLNIAILGAGIAGLCSAIALKAKGFNVTLYERSASPHTLGAGLVLWPNASQILDKLNILTDIKSAGYSLDKMQRYTETGDFLNEIDLKNFNSKSSYTNYAIKRQSLHSILIKTIQKNKITINFNYRATQIDPRSNNIAVVRFENDEIINPDIIIGADGQMNSIARKYVTGINKPIYQGYVNWVGLIEMQPRTHFDNTILDYWGCGERFGLVPLSKHAAYWAGCKAMPEGLGNPDNGNKNALLNIFKEWPHDIKSIIEQSPDDYIKRIEVYDHNPIAAWHRDNVCLIGDAAHAALPTSGQGACQAIEDAYYLAEYLFPKNVVNITNPQLAFKQLYKLRFETTRGITQNARHFAHSLFNTDPEFCESRNQRAKEQ